MTLYPNRELTITSKVQECCGREFAATLGEFDYSHVLSTRVRISHSFRPHAAITFLCSRSFQWLCLLLIVPNCMLPHPILSTMSNGIHHFCKLHDSVGVTHVIKSIDCINFWRPMVSGPPVVSQSFITTIFKEHELGALWLLRSICPVHGSHQH